MQANAAAAVELAAGNVAPAHDQAAPAPAAVAVAGQPGDAALGGPREGAGSGPLEVQVKVQHAGPALTRRRLATLLHALFKKNDPVTKMYSQLVARKKQRNADKGRGVSGCFVRW